MRDLLTPKQVARAIQVSESSVKRWCDKGLITTRYTAGGHRRVPLSALMEFLRTNKYELVRPDVVGLPATTGQTSRVIDRATTQLVQALIRGDEEQCRQIIVDLYLAEHSISTICDQVIAKAFVAIGELWQCGEAEIYQERLGCEIMLRELHQLNSFIPAPPPDSALAIGGATSGDEYDLATTMVELVLRDAKWNAISLGTNLPFETLHAAIQEQHPRMFWLSCSHMLDESKFLREYASLYDEFGMDVAFVVGGRSLSEDIRQHMKYAAYCDNMQHLEAFAQTLRGSSN